MPIRSASPDYEDLKRLAHEKRQLFGLTTESISLAAVSRIFKAEGIAIDRWKLSRRLRAVYMCDDNDPSVLVNRDLPDEPRMFAMIHELKHHYRDRAILEAGQIPCGDYNENRVIEIGAEVFAAEFIFPEGEFSELIRELGLSARAISEEDVVRLKRATRARISYTFLRKRLERLNLVPRGQFLKTKFQLLEEQMFGVPVYKQAWFKDLRARRAAQRARVS